MVFSFLEADFLGFIQIIVWCFLPIYASFLGLSLPFLAKAPSTSTLKNTAREEGSTVGVYRTQVLFWGAALFLMTAYRGHVGSICHGQLNLASNNVKLLFLVSSMLGAALVASPSIGVGALKANALGFSTWYLGPTLATLWAFLALTTQLTTSLLILELVGVGLVWALSNTTLTANQGTQRPSTTAPGLVYALVIFVWASGISALALLIGLGLTSLEGGVLNFLGAKGLTKSLYYSTQAWIGAGEVLFLLVLSLKFLMGGGQFLLLAWYRFLPQSGLVFYLFFYYPAHLLIGTTFLLGFILSPLSIVLGVLVLILLGVTFALLPHLGAQVSPALTLGGSSFIALSFLAIAMLNLVP